MGEGGDLFVLDMGEQVRILDLAETMIRLSGYRPGVDIEIEITGPRPGEKMYEELLTLEEGAVATQHARIMRVPAASHFAVASRAPEQLWRDLMALARAASQDDYGRIARAVGRIVPEFQPAAAGAPALAEVAATASGPMLAQAHGGVVAGVSGTASGAAGTHAAVVTDHSDGGAS